MCVSTLTDCVLIKKTVESTICSVAFHETVTKFWSLIFGADEEEICLEQQAIIKLIYQQKQAIPPQSQIHVLPRIHFADYKRNKSQCIPAGGMRLSEGKKEVSFWFSGVLVVGEVTSVIKWLIYKSQLQSLLLCLEWDWHDCRLLIFLLSQPCFWETPIPQVIRFS